jgi:hypothetical protein
MGFSSKAATVSGRSDRRAMPVDHAGTPIAGLDAEALEDSNERSTC